MATKFVNKTLKNKKELENMIPFFMLCLFAFPLTIRAMINNNIAKPGCQTQCGNVNVPYPYGIGKDTNCSLDDSFYMNCNTTYDPPQLFVKGGNLRVHSILDSELRIFTFVSF